MAQSTFFKWILLFWAFMPAASLCFAVSNAENKLIEQLYHKLSHLPQNDMQNRITAISSWFLGKPYLLGALGEGNHGAYDQFPLHRFDAFDCETFVDTVLALALAEDAQTFKQCINQIRYRDGKVSFFNRNHFASLDWNLNNQKQGFLKDITPGFTNKHNKPVAKIAKAYIDKPAWYRHFDSKIIRIADADERLINQKLQSLKERGGKLQGAVSVIPYIPLSVLFTKKGEPNQHLFKQIPNASIIEIVRPNWDLRSRIGTCLNVSHLGFAIWKDDTLMFREASSIHQRTVDVPLIDYLQDALKSPTIQGINVQIVLPEKTFKGDCRNVGKNP